jgi:hypothetical protein
VGTSHIPSRTLPNHFLLLISTASVFIQRSTSNQISAPHSLTNQRSQRPLQVWALPHLDLYKRRSSQPANINIQCSISHLQQTAAKEVSQHAWSRATGLRSHRHYTAPGTAASALRRSCPTHRATDRLDSPVAMPDSLGNWHLCYTPPLRCPRSRPGS